MSPDLAQSLSPSPELPSTRSIALIPVIPFVHTALDAPRLQSSTPPNRGHIDLGSTPATKKCPLHLSPPGPRPLALWHVVRYQTRCRVV